MVLYNTLMGVCAGSIMLLMADLLRRLSSGKMAENTPMYGPALLVLGIPLTVLSGHMALTWPLTVNPPINIAFAEPALMLGLLATLAGAYLTRTAHTTFSIRMDSLWPIKGVVFVLGLVLAMISSAIFSYNLVGDAPPQEPITGQATGWENTVFGLAYAVAAGACLLLPFAKIGSRNVVTYIVMSWWTLAGLFFLLFSVLNYRTHIGLLINLEQGTNYRW